MDVTPELAQVQAQALLSEIMTLEVECRKYQDLFEQAPDAYLVTTLEGVIQNVNSAAERLFKQGREKLSGHSLTAYIAQENQPWFFNQLNKFLTLARKDELEIAFQVEKVTSFTGSATISFICDAQGSRAGLRWLIRDASEHKKVMDQVLYDVDQVLYDTFHDRLTGLSNRASVCDHLEHALTRYKHDANHAFALLFLNIDRFKVINDSLGHMAGDRLLIELATRLQACVRSEDILACLEGDEFLLLLDRVVDISEAEFCAKQIQAVLSTPYLLNDYKIVMQSSIGICLGSAHYQMSTELIRDANLAMC